MSPLKLPGSVSLFVLFVSGCILLLYGCSGQTTAGKISIVTETATFPTNQTSITTEEFSTPSFPIPPTSISKPQTSKADLSIEFTPAIDKGSNPKNVYTLTIHNLGPDLATDILITHVFPFGTDSGKIKLLQPICQFRKSQVTCEVGDTQANDRMAVTLDLASGPAYPVIPEIQRSRLSPNTILPVCSFDETAAQPLRLICHLQSLKPGMRAQINMGLSLDVEPGIHRFSIAAAQADPDLSNNTGSATIALPPVQSTMPPDLIIQATGPVEVVAGRPFTYIYRITNQGTQPAKEVKFDDPIPPGLRLQSYAPGLPLCEQKADTLTCSLVDPDSGEKATFMLTISGMEQKPFVMDVDPLIPGWPVCYVLKEQKPLQVLHCDLGTFEPGQSTQVRLEMLAIGVLERTTTNAVAVESLESDLAPTDNANSIDIAVRVEADMLIRADPPKWSAADKTLSYRIEVEDQGPSDADVGILTGTLTSGTQLLSANLDSGSKCQVEADHTLTCNVAYLKGGETTALTLVLSVPDNSTPQDEAEAFLRSLRVVAQSFDPNPDNNAIVGPIMINNGETK